MGEIVWCRGERAGVRFESSVSVTEWLPGRSAIPPQQRVDEMVQRIKASGTGTSVSAATLTLQSSEVSAAELTQMRIAIESLAEDLSADPQVVKRHMAKLQTLDLTAQILRKLANGR